jgi:hypothetical protein
MNPRPPLWRTWLLLTPPGLLWLSLLDVLQGYAGGPVRLWLRTTAVALAFGLAGTALALPVGQRLSARRRSGAAAVLIWSVTLAAAVAGALAAAGPVCVALFGARARPVAHDAVAGFLFLLPLALLALGAHRVRLHRAAAAAHRRIRRH